MEGMMWGTLLPSDFIFWHPRNGWLPTGSRCARFEEDFARFVGAKHALAVNSATAALHLGLEALGIGEGDMIEKVA